MNRMCFLLFALLLGACSGKTSDTPDAGDGGGADASSTAPRDSGPGPARDADPDCGQPPQAVYMCPEPRPDAAACGPYGRDAGALPDASFPLGCVVTLPECAAFGVLTCYCDPSPIDPSAVAWECPL